ncbi:MAG: universal stress protein [Deltaproteobacteria bacterium]|nr:universal stress protein [Kofleriaceae bacterium]
MFRRVLVATDFSAGAAAALDRALRLPLTADARLELVHVLADGAGTAALERATERLDGEIARVRSAHPALAAQIGGSCAFGRTHVEIVRAARARDAELIVVGVHGVRRLRDLVRPGSTASRVVHTGDVPVLLVRSPSTGAYRRVMVAAALSDVDARLLQLAGQLGVTRPAVVHVVHVPFETFQASSEAGRERIRAEYCADAATRLDAALVEVGGGEPWRTIVKAGDIRAEILEEARRHEVDLLICGTHARGGLAHALLGSVAETLVAAAPCDVLVARPTRFTFELP